MIQFKSVDLIAILYLFHIQAFPVIICLAYFHICSCACAILYVHLISPPIISHYLIFIFTVLLIILFITAIVAFNATHTLLIRGMCMLRNRANTLEIWGHSNHPKLSYIICVVRFLHPARFSCLH